MILPNDHIQDDSTFFKVMIVDDETLFCQGFINALNWQEYGYNIIGEASNGLEALSLCDLCTPDFVVTDIRMPDMNGIELTKTLKEKYPAVKIIILSSYSDFYYAREAMKYDAELYLLKPEIEFEDVLDAMDNIRKEIVREWNQETRLKQYKSKERFDAKNKWLNQIMGDKYDKSFGNQMKAIGINLKPDCIRSIVFTCDDNQNKIDGYSLYTLETIFFSEFTNINFFIGKDNEIICVFNESHMKSESVTFYVRRIQDSLKGKFGLIFTASISSVLDNYFNLPRLLRQAIQAAEYKFYKGSNSVIFWSELQVYQSDINERLKTSVFFDHASNGNWDNLIPAIDQLFMEISRSPFIPPNVVKKFFTSLLGSLHNHVNFDFEYDYWDELQNLTACAYLKVLEKRVLDIVIKIIKQIKDEHCHPIIKKTKSFISSHLSEKLSLKFVAMNVHTSSEYLSSLFKKETGINFNAYVTMMKMEQAKKLLIKNEISITAVAQKLGYDNISYFTKLFTKTVGSNPNKYKKH